MLPTPSTSHVCFDTIYEPAEDSYLLLDTLSSPSEAAWLSNRFSTGSNCHSNRPPLVAEIGPGSGVVLAFVAANSNYILGRSDILTLGVDVNRNACAATEETVRIALDEKSNCRQDSTKTGVGPQMVATITGDLCSPLRYGSVDILIFNPPYVPTPELPSLPSSDAKFSETAQANFDRDSHLLSLSYAGGEDGMETTNRLLKELPHALCSRRGVAYILLCAQNRPDEVRTRIQDWGPGWSADIVSRSGMKAGWEKLVILRIWREMVG